MSIWERALGIAKTAEKDMKEIAREERERCAKAICKGCLEGYDRNATDLGTYHNLGHGQYLRCAADRIFAGTY